MTNPTPEAVEAVAASLSAIDGRVREADARHALAFIRDAIHRDGPDADAIRETLGLKAEWTVRHAQGIHPGPFTEQSARSWIDKDREADSRRQAAYQGKQRLLRRVMGEWQETP